MSQSSDEAAHEMGRQLMQEGEKRRKTEAAAAQAATQAAKPEDDTSDLPPSAS